MSDNTKPPRRRHRSVVFPAMMIIVGMLFLFSNLGLLPPNFWQNIWRLWPVILILIGVEIVFNGRTGWRAIGAIVSISVLVVLVGFAVVYSSSWTTNNSAHTGPLQFGNILTTSGNVITEERHFTDFDRVSVSSPVEVDIVHSDWFSVNVTADDNLMGHIIITQEGSELKVRMDAITINSNPTMKVRITMPTLNHLSLNSAAHTTVQNFETTHDFQTTVEGASTLIGDINSDSLHLQVSGASKATLTGSANKATLSVSGASKLDMSAFTLITADANVSGASSALILVSDNLEADVSGASTLTYSGNPTLANSKTSGASSINHR